MATLKRRTIAVDVPLPILWAIIESWPDPKKWAVLENDLQAGIYEIRRKIWGEALAPEARGKTMRLGVRIDPGSVGRGRGGVMEAWCGWPDSTELFKGKYIENNLDEFCKYIETQVQNSVASGEARANSWRPPV